MTSPARPESPGDGLSGEGQPQSGPSRPRFPFLDPFVLALGAVVLLAFLLPARGGVAAVLTRSVDGAIAWLFFLYGVRLPTREALAAVKNYRLQSSVLAVTYVLFPIFGALAWWACTPLLATELRSGLLFFTLVPSTVQSSVAFTSIARGNVAGALCAATLSNLIGVFATPLLVSLLLGGGGGVQLSSIGSIALLLVAPFFLGQLCRPWLLGWLQRNARLLSLSDRAAILLVVYVAFARAVSERGFSVVSATDLLGVLGACACLLGLLLWSTSRLGRALGFERADRIVLLFCGSKKSLASGLPIATLLLPSVSAGLLVLPLMVYHQLQLVVCSVLAQRFGRQAEAARGG